MDDPSHLYTLVAPMFPEISQLLILLVFSAFFSASETALTSMTKLRIKGLIEKEGKKAEVINRWLKKPNRLLIAILAGNNLVNLYAASLMTLIVSDSLGGTPTAEIAGIATGLIGFLILVFGEVFPKTYAKAHAERLSLLVVRPIEVLSWLLSPLIYILDGASWLIMRIFGLEMGVTSRLFITEDEIMRLLDVSQQEGLLKEDEREMISSVFEFRDTEVKEVMVPRTEMFAIDIEEEDFSKILGQILDAGHSRIPVFEAKIDDILGILYARDLLYYWDRAKSINIKQLLRPAFYIPESKKVNTLLKEFQQNKTHIAIVVDEYGGTAGLVTIEDLLEEIVGEIFDEYDTEEKMYEIKEDGSITVNARMDLEEANEIFGINLPEEDSYETIGGFIFDQLERVPEADEELLFDNLVIKVISVDGGTIEKVKIVKTGPTTEGEEEE